MKTFFVGLLVVSMATLYGCGGSGDSGDSGDSGGGSGPMSLTLSGTVSKGAALPAGTEVTLKDANGVSKATSIVGENGAYSIVVDGLTAPYVLNSGGYYSFASAPGTMNINPFTHLAMQLTLGKSTINDADSTSLPANFQTHFTSVVTDLMTKTDGLYPPSVSATQKDFLNGDITIDAGVDKVFSSLTLTPPDASGNFSASVSGQQIFSGTISSGVVAITPDATAISSSNSIIFPINSLDNTYSISGTITSDGVGLAEVSVAVRGGGSTISDASGNYTISGLANGLYFVTIVMGGPITQVVTVNGANETGQDFNATPTPTPTPTPVPVSTFAGVYSGTYTGTYKEADKIYYSSEYGSITLTIATNGSISGGSNTKILYNKIKGSLITNYPLTISGQVDSHGNVSFQGSSWLYRVTFTGVATTQGELSGTWTFDELIGSGTFTTHTPYSISGNITSGGSALAGVTVGTSGGSTTSTESGSYTINGLVAGTYTITPTKTGYAFTPTSLAVDLNGTSKTDRSFTATPIYSISGKITAGGSPLAGVTVNTGGGSATTDSGGNYTISGLTNGSYTVTPTKTGYAFTPANQAITVDGANVTGKNCTATNTGSITVEW